MGFQSSVPCDQNRVLAGPKVLYCKSMQWTKTWHTKTWSRKSFTALRSTSASCISVTPVLALQLWKNFLIRNLKNMKFIRNLVTVSGHYGSNNIDNLYNHLRRIQKDFDWYYWWFNKTFLYRKTKTYQFLIQDEI